MAEQEGKQETPKENWADTIEVRDAPAAAPEMDSPDSKILNQEEIDSLLGEWDAGRRFTLSVKQGE